MSSLNTPHHTEFHLASTFWLSITGGTLILPFSIYHLVIQNLGISIGAAITSFSLYLVAWSCQRNTYRTIYTFLWFTPFTSFFIAYVIYRVGITGTYWCYATVVLYYFMMSERQAWASNIFFALVNLPMAWQLFETHEAMRFSVTFLLVCAYSAIFLHIISGQYSELHDQAITDKLTGLYNRTLYQDSLEQAVHQANRTNTPYSLIILDIDHFKKINDDFGHDKGDQVLSELGAFLQDSLRDSDKVFRIGGEEFLILAFNAKEADSFRLAEKLRENIENLPLLPDRKVTVSIGVADLNSSEDWKQWVKACDKNLYEAKTSGRNRVVASSVSGLSV